MRLGRHAKHTNQSGPEKTNGAPATSAVNHEAIVKELREAVDDRDTKIRNLHATLLNQVQRSNANDLDDRQVRARFQTLSQSINDWVLASYKDSKPRGLLPPETAMKLQGIVPNYQKLLLGPSTRYLVIRALIADALVGAFSNDELIGSPAFSELKKSIDKYGKSRVCKR